MRGWIGRGTVAVALVAGAVATAGCGAKEAAVLNTAFERDIDSATVAMTFAVKTQGGDVRLAVTGPYRSNGAKELPSVDWRVRLDGAGPTPITGRVISTPTNAFVQYDGTTYEVGESQVRQLAQQSAGDGAQQLSPGDLRALMGKAQGWFPRSDTQEDAQLSGEAVTRVTGRLDLAAALTDLKDLADRPGLSGAEELKSLSDADIAQLQGLVSDPRFTVDVAKSDGKLRRVAGQVRLKQAAGGGTVSFSIRFTDVDKPVRIDAPTSGRPIAELGKKLERVFGAATPAMSS